MRVYFEKPRTTIGWKGLINDPDLNGSNNINKGLKIARRLLVDIASLGLPTATEFLDPITPQYIGDLISWGAIGARTTESQIHRQLASGLSAPIGFKNSTDGSIQIAIDAIKSASNPHMFLSVTKKGNSAIVSTSGNSDCHVIHRGGSIGPNYSEEQIIATSNLLQKNGIDTGIMVDLSHANSNKDFNNQMVVANSIGNQIATGNEDIVGIMIESNLVQGNQAISADKSTLLYGQSVTDACLGWDSTLILLEQISREAEKRRLNARS
jgi:3-deoxy-7-phosphoheptulonate synthase